MSTLKVNTIQDALGNNPSTAAQLKQGRAKAWVTFNVQSTGINKTIRASYNVDSVTDIATGRFGINFTDEALADANYSFSGNICNDNSTMVTSINVQGDGDFSTSTLDIRCVSPSNSTNDGFTTCITVHGN